VYSTYAQSSKVVLNGAYKHQNQQTTQRDFTEMTLAEPRYMLQMLSAHTHTHTHSQQRNYTTADGPRDELCQPKPCQLYKQAVKLQQQQLLLLHRDVNDTSWA